MTQLEPCPSCKRHIKLEEAACPFCRSPLSDDFRAKPARPRPRGRLGLRASFAFGLTVAASCGGKEISSVDAGAPEDARAEPNTIFVPSGEDPSLHIPDAGTTTPDPIDAEPPWDDDAIVAIYRASPP
jgi:hypothetical protein